MSQRDLAGQQRRRGYASSAIFTDPDLDSLRGDPGLEAMVAWVHSRRTYTAP